MSVPTIHQANGRPGNCLVALRSRFERSSQIRTDLERFGIIIAAPLSDGDSFAEAAGRYGCDVLLVEQDLLHRPNESGTTSDWKLQFENLVATARSIGAGICVVAPEESESVCELLSLGADSIAFADQSAALLAVAIFTAHNGALTRRLLTKKVHDLEQKVEHDRCIQQAKSILAEQMKITEAAALRHLRKEARDQRKSMLQLARIVIEAHRIASPKDKTPPKKRRSPGSPSGNGDGVDLESDES